MRKDKTPTQYLQEVEAAKGKERMMIDQKMGPLNKIRARLTAAPGEDIHFVKIESTGVDDGRGLELGIFALAVFELDGPGSKEFPEKQQFAAAVIKARTKGRQYEWWVDSYIFPYSRALSCRPRSPSMTGMVMPIELPAARRRPQAHSRSSSSSVPSPRERLSPPVDLPAPRGRK